MKTLLCAVLLLVPATAQQRSRTEMPKATQSGKDDPTVDYYRSIADYFKLSERAVIALQKKGIQAEELPAVLWITKHSKISPNQVVEQKTAGKDFAAIAKENNVSLKGDDFVSQANIRFLSEYHGRKADEVAKLHRSGTNWMDINTQLRRGETEAQPGSKRP